MIHWLRDFTSLWFIVSIMNMIYMRLRVDLGVICLYLAIKSRGPFRGKRGRNEKKSFQISFSPRNWPTLLFSCHWTTSRRFWNFDHVFYLTLSSSKWAWPRWAKNLKCKYKYLTNWTQLSRKQWDWQLLLAPFMGFKKRKISDFSVLDI